jgi:hypothetical protein
MRPFVSRAASRMSVRSRTVRSLVTAHQPFEASTRCSGCATRERASTRGVNLEFSLADAQDGVAGVKASADLLGDRDRRAARRVNQRSPVQAAGPWRRSSRAASVLVWSARFDERRGERLQPRKRDASCSSEFRRKSRPESTEWG